MAGELKVSEARQRFADMVNRAAYGGERVVVRRRNREVAAVVPIEDLRLLEQLEDRLDLDHARAALKERGAVSWNKLKAKLGL